MLPDQSIIEEHVKGVDLIATRIAVAKGQRCENREKGSSHARLGLVDSRESRSFRFRLRRLMRPP